MNENIDLTKILEKCPEGWEFYHAAYGRVWFYCIDLDFSFPIRLSLSKEIFDNIGVTSKGTINNYNGECLLFPSKEQRDWSKFSAPWYKKEESVKPKFKVGDKIVNVPMKYEGFLDSGIISKITDDKYIFIDGSYTSISSQDSWELVPDKKPKFDPKTLQSFDKVLARDYLHGKWTCGFFSHIVIFNNTYMYNIGEVIYKMCIPYNNDTKHLVGTTDEAPEFYRYWED